MREHSYITTVIADCYQLEWNGRRIDFLNRDERGNASGRPSPKVYLHFQFPLPVYLDFRHPAPDGIISEADLLAVVYVLMMRPVQIHYIRWYCNSMCCIG